MWLVFECQEHLVQKDLRVNQSLFSRRLCDHKERLFIPPPPDCWGSRSQMSQRVLGRTKTEEVTFWNPLVSLQAPGKCCDLSSLMTKPAWDTQVDQQGFNKKQKRTSPGIGLSNNISSLQNKSINTIMSQNSCFNIWVSVLFIMS